MKYKGSGYDARMDKICFISHFGVISPICFEMWNFLNDFCKFFLEISLSQIVNSDLPCWNSQVKKKSNINSYNYRCVNK